MNRFWLFAVSAAAMLALMQVNAVAQDSKYRPEIKRLTAELAKDTHKDVVRIQLATQYYLEASDLSMAGKHDAASKGFTDGLGILRDKDSTVPENQPVYEEMRYGLGYSDLMLGRAQDAVTVLDPLVASSPNVVKARYLLAASLLATGTDTSFKRGLEVMSLMASQSLGPEKNMALRGASRWSYDLAVTLAAEGKAVDALALMNDLRSRFGTSSGATTEENQAMQYGVGYFNAQSGNSTAGGAEFEKLMEQNAGYKLANGVSLKTVTSNTYYQAGLEQLSLKTRDSSTAAIAAFNKTDQYGSGSDVDAMHGRAIAYKNLEQFDQMLQELARIEKADPAYFKSINTGG